MDLNVVEPQLPKLDVTGSIPVSRSRPWRILRGNPNLPASAGCGRHGLHLDQADSQASYGASEQAQQHQHGHALKKCILH